MIKLNGRELIFESFPNGETKVDGDQIMQYAFHPIQDNVIDFKYENDGDLLRLLFVKNKLDELSTGHCYLNILYMPYSRMDRVEGNSVFTLKYVADFINAMNFRKVFVHEPHSDVTPALLNHCVVIHGSIELLEIVAKKIEFDKEKDYLFLPDAGAAKRYSLPGYQTLLGHKKRNFQTGAIESLEVIGELKEGSTVVIVDDLCSRGGTFILSAKKLKELGAGRIYLVVSHCEKSILDGEIPGSDVIDQVYTSDSIIDEMEHDMITVYPIVEDNYRSNLYKRFELLDK